MKSNISFNEAAIHTWDVIVVGAGPAGALTALLLAKATLRVLLIDKDAYPRFKVCGCALSPEAVEILRAHHLLHALITESISLKTIQVISNKKVCIKLSGGLAVDRSFFDDYLCQQASQYGAKVLFQVKANNFAYLKDSVSLSLTNQENKTINLSSALVIDACGLTGLKSSIEQQETEIAKSSYIGVGAELESTAMKITESDIVMMLGSQGYFGALALKNRINLGAAVSPDLIRKSGSVDAAVKVIAAQAGHKNFAALPVLNWKGTPSLTRKRSFTRPRYFAVGDAASYIEPFTGEGITWALLGATKLAPIILEAIEQYTPDVLKKWEYTYKIHISKSQTMCSLTCRVLRFPDPLRSGIIKLASHRLAPKIFQKVTGLKQISWTNFSL